MRTERIGVTGHRWNRLDRAKAGDLESALGALFRTIVLIADRPRTLVCGMAEGADMIAAASRPADWALEAALPLPRPAWVRHLAAQPDITGDDLAELERLMDRAKVVTVNSMAVEPDFIALADHIATSCHCVVAVWDGMPGRPGGTADVVDRARVRGTDLRILDARPFLIG